MMNNMKKLIGYVLCIVMTLSLSISAHAKAAVLTQFEGVIVSDLTHSNLSNIEVQVYSAEPMETDDPTSVIYAETYAFSVFTDQNGSFEFEKPSSYCSFTINLDSLPEGYGVDTKTKFIIPTSNSITIQLNEVSDSTVVRNNGTFFASLYDKNGNEIFANYTIGSQESRLATQTSTHTVSTEKSTLSTLASAKEVCHEGTIRSGGFCDTYTIKADVSQLSVTEKIEYMFREELITQEQKIEYYLDILESDNIQLGDTCGNALIYELESFLQSAPNTANETKLQQRCHSVLSTMNNLSKYNSPPDTVPIYQDGQLIYTFNIYFDETLTSTTYISTIKPIIHDVFEFFVITKEFNFSQLNSESKSMDVYLVESANLPSNAGAAYYVSTNEIRINYQKTANDFREYFAHEFNHALLYDYDIAYSGEGVLLHEACSSAASFLYCQNNTYPINTTALNSKLSAYLNHVESSIFNFNLYNNYEYGMMLLPIYLYEIIGGWSTIKALYSNYALYDDLCDAIDNLIGVSSYQNVFNGFATRNLNPSKTYSTIANSAWTQFTEYPSPGVLSGISVAQMSYQYHRFSRESTQPTTTYYITVDVINTHYSDFYINTARVSQAGTNIHITTLSGSNNRYTFQQSGFDGTNIKFIYIIPVNGGRNNPNITINITASE